MGYRKQFTKNINWTLYILHKYMDQGNYNGN